MVFVKFCFSILIWITELSLFLYLIFNYNQIWHIHFFIYTHFTKEFFKSELISTKKGNREEIIPIVPLVPNYSEVIIAVKKLYEFIAKRNPTLAENINILHEYDVDGIIYSKGLMYYDDEVHIGYTANDFLHTVEFDKKISNDNTPVIIPTVAPNIRQITIKWITENLPNEREIRQNYWERYLNSNPKNDTIQNFTQFTRENTTARELTYRGKRIWTYRKKANGSL